VGVFEFRPRMRLSSDTRIDVVILGRKGNERKAQVLREKRGEWPGEEIS